MARGTQHRKRRPQANARLAAQPAAARAPKRPTRPAWEEQLFFGKVRKRGKWIMIVLAFVFLFSFVLLGVGSGSSGISQILSSVFSGSSGGGSSESALQKQTTEHPKDAAAWLALANKLQADNKDDQAAQALTTYTTLKPSNQDALQQLAEIYLQRATDWETLYEDSQAYTQALAPSPVVAPSSSSKIGQALASVATPLVTAASSGQSTATSNDYSQVINYLDQRETVYKKLAKLSPQDANTQLTLAQAAQDASDSKTAITAYKAFLKLAPTDAEAPSARSALKQLEAQQAATTTPTASATTTTGGKASSSAKKSKKGSKTGSKKK